ncbi:MAG TPA: diguanylate cyclase, partial [bacterium]|nr:diguanylate cyclase [bacterium]
YFRSRIEEEIARAKRKNYVFTLVLMEIVGMDEFVEMYGEPERRKALMKIAGMINEIFRTTDLLGRHGDNQFLMMLPETDDRSSVIPIMRLKKLLTSAGFGPDKRFNFDVNFGVSCYPKDVTEVGGLLSLASASLKRSTQKGTGMITLASSLFRKGPGQN